MMEYKTIVMYSRTDKLTTISEEEENYARMDLLLTKFSTRAVHVLFNNELESTSPDCLKVSIRNAYRNLHELKMKRIISKPEWDLLFPSKGEPNSETFDVTLMITLLTNLSKLVHYDDLPLETDTTPASDLARIKYYRNHMSHNTDGKIDSLVFNAAWNDMTEAIGRLGGIDMLNECKESRTQRLDKSTVPWNIRDQISQILETWKMNDSNFVETNAAQYVFECIHENSCVTITASSGVGKTAILQHVALKMGNEGYNILLVTDPKDIVKFYNPNLKTLFVIDDFCGTYSINQSYLKDLHSVIGNIKVLIQNEFIKIIVACRLQVYQDDKFESLSMFSTCVCNLQSEDLCLSETEKLSIAETYLGKKATKIMQYWDLHKCSPLLCKLYTNNPTPNMQDFFKNPFLVYEAEIDKLHKNGHYQKYCALALFVMFDNKLMEEWLTTEDDPTSRIIIEITCEACRLDRGTSPLVLLNELKALENTFVKKDKNEYKIIHEKIFDYLVYYYGQKILPCLIRSARSRLIMQRFAFEKKSHMEQFITLIPAKYQQMYIQRMVDEWSIGGVYFMCFNNNLEIPEFRNKFICHLHTLDILQQRQLALTCDFAKRYTAMIYCCFLGYIPLIEWCISQGVSVNQLSYDGTSALHAAADGGKTDVVRFLLNNKADINKRRDNGQTSLSVSCQKNHIKVLKVLLENKADINMSTYNGISPLLIACNNNLIEIVKVLLDNEADTNKGCTDDNGGTPLLAAIDNNNIEIVKLLLDNKADINKGTNNGATPMMMACQNDHYGTVKVLLDNKADINKFANGRTPLLIACQYNCVRVVQLLLDYNADINICRDDGESPLSVACYLNHIETVNILLNNKADITRCKADGTSPLFIACEMNHEKLVCMLLDRNADINNWKDGEKSPLLMACHKNHKEIVQVLLDNNADINMSTGNGTTPLLNACHNNHIEIIKVLLDNNAEINLSDDNGTTPLLNACHNNHIEIVKILLDNKADTNTCSNNGFSPLLIACEKNHIELVRVLLEYKADITWCFDNGISLLLVACLKNYLEMVKVLLDNKADINKSTDEGTTPLFVACENSHLEIVNVLLDNKADINKCTDNGVSSLNVACQNNYIDVVKVLLDNKADINKCSDDGVSPLFIACMKNQIETVKVLLENKANINIQRDDGESPLSVACYLNHIDIVHILLKNKADINQSNHRGLSPLLVACHAKHIEIVKILLDKI